MKQDAQGKATVLIKEVQLRNSEPHAEMKTAFQQGLISL